MIRARIKFAWLSLLSAWVTIAPLSTAQLPPATVIAPPPVIAAGIDTDRARAGQAIFSRIWVADIPGVTQDFDGLGPHYSARSCLECHQGAAQGRKVSQTTVAPSSLLLAPSSMWAAEFGSHLTDRAVLFTDPEITIADGSVQHRDSGIAAPEPNTVARRTAPSLLMMPLMIALSDAQIMAYADPNDHNNDGISGRPRLLGDQQGVGRFGWKSSHATLERQILAAFRDDLGVTPDELGQSHIRDVSAYLSALPTPVLGTEPPEFAALGCAACHVAHNGLYSDMLLHDMGQALADPFGSFARLWRTAPLGDVRDAFTHTSFLHDGRATSLDMAVRLHGGEGAHAAQAWQNAPQDARNQIETWLKSVSIQQ